MQQVLKEGLIRVILAVMMTLLMAPGASAKEEAIRGVVVETMNSGGYTYLLIERPEGKDWFAVPESLVRVGDEVQVAPGVQMGSYTSKTLDRTFDQIVFSSGITGMLKRVVKDAEVPGEAQAMETIPKAEGANAYTIAEVFEKRDALNGKQVVVRGKVVKITQFEGEQWLRIIDGSGSSKRGNHKLVVVSAQNAAKDDIVTATGTVRTGKAFGPLTYEVVVEKAKIELKKASK